MTARPGLDGRDPAEVKDATEELASCYRDMAEYGRRCAAAHMALAETHEKLAAATTRVARTYALESQEVTWPEPTPTLPVTGETETHEIRLEGP